MSLTKRHLDTINEKTSAINCPDCKINYNDKFIEVYCSKHAEQEFEQNWLYADYTHEASPEQQILNTEVKENDKRNF